MPDFDLIAVVGPTASGKTARAVDIANMLHTEIISADSRQLYRGMTLGTGKDIEEYGDVRYHLIDVANAGERWNLHRFLSCYREVEANMRMRHLMPIVCGGSGMYVEAILSGVVLPEVPEDKILREKLKNKTLTELAEQLASLKRLHNTTDIDTTQRAIRAIEIELYYKEHPEAATQANHANALRPQALIIGIDIDRDARRQRITERLKRRLDNGMLDEIRTLLDSGLTPDMLMYYGLEYKFLTRHVVGEISYDEMFRQLETAIHQFAKRQMTWFRGMERRGYHINWLPYDMPHQEFLQTISDLINKN